MAKTKAPKGNETPPAGLHAVPPLNPVEMDWSTQPDPLYANVVAVVPTVEAFGVLFAEVMPPASTGKNDKEETVEFANIVASVRIPPSVMAAFLEKAVVIWNQYLKVTGRTDLPRFERIKPEGTGQ